MTEDELLNLTLQEAVRVLYLPRINDNKRAPNCICDRMHPDALARVGRCGNCDTYQHPEYREAWDSTQPKAPPIVVTPTRCRHLGRETGKRHLCESCAGHVELKEQTCAIHGICTQGANGTILAQCQGCSDKVTGDQ